jgi:hypothetical protein
MFVIIEGNVVYKYFGNNIIAIQKQFTAIASLIKEISGKSAL